MNMTLRDSLLGLVLVSSLGCPSWMSRAVAQPTVEVVARIADAGRVHRIGFSPDGRLVLCLGDTTFTLWDIETGRLLRTFSTSHRIASVAFSPDGMQLASGAYDGSVELWDAETGRVLRAIAGALRVTSVAFASDGLRLLSASEDATLHLWDPRTGRLIRTFDGEKDAFFYRASGVFSPDGRQVLSSGKNVIKFLDVETGARRRVFSARGDDLELDAFSPDGRRAVFEGGTDSQKVLTLRDTESGRELRTLEQSPTDPDDPDKPVFSVGLASDGRHVLTGRVNDPALRLWDTETGQVVRTFDRPKAAKFDSPTFSPDGRRVLSIEDTAVKLWDLETGQLVRAFADQGDLVSGFVISHDGRDAVSRSADATLEVWDLETGQLVRTITEDKKGQALAMSRDGRLLLTGSENGGVELWDANTGQLLRSVAEQSAVVAVAFAPDDQQWLVGTETGLALWKSAQLVRRFDEPDGTEGAVVFSPDGRRAVSASRSEQPTAKLWDTETGRLLRSFTGHDHRIVSLAFSPDGGLVLSGSMDGTAIIWDAKSGRLLHTLEHSSVSHPAIRSVAFSPDGRRVVSGGSTSAVSSGDDTMESAVKTWDAETGHFLRAFEGHTGGIISAAFSPDGTRIISGGFDQTIKVWDAASAQLLLTLNIGRGNEWVAITKDGFFTGSKNLDEMLSVVRGLKAYSVVPFQGDLNRPDLIAELLQGDPEGKYKAAVSKLDLQKLLASVPTP